MTISAENMDAIIDNAFNNKPTEFLQAFSDIMKDKLSTAVAQRKVEVAQSIYKPADVIAAEKEVVVPDDAGEEEVA